MGVQSGKVPTSTGTKIPVAVVHPEPAAAQVAPAAARVEVQRGKDVVVTAEEDEAVVTRSEEMESLPEFGDVTGLEAVEAGMSIFITPLRSGKFAAAYFDEATRAATIAGKAQALIGGINGLIEATMPGFDFNTVSVGGRVELAALRLSEPFKNGRCGVYKVRVLEACANAVIKVLQAEAVVTAAFGTEWTHETIIPDDYYPGAVIEQVSVQNKGLAAAFKRDLSVGKNVFVYQVELTSAAQLAIIEKRGYLVQLGSHGKFAMRAIERRVSFETIYAYGCSGVASAKDVLAGPISAALAVPADMMRVSGVNSTVPGMGTVVAIKYPYSKANYDAAAKLLDQGQFKLRHPTIKSFVIEITLAITPIELQKRLAIRLMRDIESSESEDEEEPLDLRIKEGEMWVLEPVACGGRRMNESTEEGESGRGGAECKEEAKECRVEQLEEGEGGGKVVDGLVVYAVGCRLCGLILLTALWLFLGFAMIAMWPLLLVLTSVCLAGFCSQFCELGGGPFGDVLGGRRGMWRDMRRGCGCRITVVRVRRMDRLLGWGYCVRAQRRRK